MSKLPTLVLLLLFTAQAQADTVRVAVASNFLAAARALAQDFETLTGHRIDLSAGSTGKLYAQISHGAPFAIFLAANSREPERLEQDGMTAEGSRFTYAKGRLVLWSPAKDAFPQDVPAYLASVKIRRVAIANPKTAPYGVAAIQFLEAHELGKQPPFRLLTAESVAQSHQFAHSGNADLAFIALSQVVASAGADKKGSYWLVPESSYQPIEQQAVLLKTSASNAVATEFLGYLKSLPARRVIEEIWGYGVPGEAG